MRRDEDRMVLAVTLPSRSSLCKAPFRGPIAARTKTGAASVDTIAAIVAAGSVESTAYVRQRLGRARTARRRAGRFQRDSAVGPRRLRQCLRRDGIGGSDAVRRRDLR